MSSHQSDTQTQDQAANIICPKCGAVGVVVWENENDDGHVLVSLSKNFYERISKKNPYPIEIVCHNCGVAQPENPVQGANSNQKLELGRP